MKIHSIPPLLPCVTLLFTFLAGIKQNEWIVRTKARYTKDDISLLRNRSSILRKGIMCALQVLLKIPLGMDIMLIITEVEFK